MQKINPKETHQKDDEIDFKMVWFLIIESKRFIVIVTLAFTIATAIFLYFRPTYVSSATLELGSYPMENVVCHSYADILRYYNRSWLNDKLTLNCDVIEAKDSLLDNPTKLKKLLHSTFSRVSDVSVSYSSPSDNKMLIDVYSTNQENTENILLEIVTFIKKTQQLHIDELREERKKALKEYTDKYHSELSTYNNKVIELETPKNTLIEKLNLLKNRINSPLSEVEKKIDELEIILTEFHLENIEIELTILSDNSTEKQTLNALNMKRKDYQKLVSENLYKNSEIVGDINTGLYKEKNNSIILRSFAIGLMLSLLVVLFRSRNKIL